MKRFHVHIAVDNLDANIAFYSRLFAQAPHKQRPDYAKWMLDDPCINFAISARGHAVGLNHFGIQVESEVELGQLHALADAASAGQTIDQADAVCCYAKSEKHWVVDPQGLAWEHFMSMADFATFGDDSAVNAGGCCVPGQAEELPTAQAAGSFCDEADNASSKPGCCA